MKNNENLNIWSIFALNHIYKDITDEAIKAVDALMFLSPPTSSTFREKYCIQMDIGVDESTNYKSVRKIQKEESYNFADFLVLKLIENFRRIYAVSKKTNKPDDLYGINITHDFGLERSGLLDHEINPIKIGVLNDNKKSDFASLLNQQNNIYFLINKVNDFLNFDKENKFYPKAVAGKNYETTIFEISCYLGAHQSLNEKNVKTHQQFIEKISPLFSIEDIKQQNLKLFNKLSYPYNRRSFVQMYLNKLSSSKILDEYLSTNFDNNSNFYKITLIDFLAGQEDLNLNQEQKQKLLIKTFSNPFFKYLSPKESIDFQRKLEKVLVGANFKILFENNVLSIHNKDSTEYKFTFDRVKVFDSPQLFLKIFHDSISEALRNQFIEKFDLNDSNLFKKIIDTLAEKSNRIKLLQSIIPSFSNVLNKDSLAYVVAKDANFFSIIQPYYLVEKLSPLLNSPNKETSITRHRKI